MTILVGMMEMHHESHPFALFYILSFYVYEKLDLQILI